MGGSFGARSDAMRGGAILVRRHIGMVAPHGPPAHLAAIDLHFVAPNFRFRLWGDISVADLLDFLELDFASTARTLPDRYRYFLGRRVWRSTRIGWGWPVSKRPLPGLASGRLGILLSPAMFASALAGFFGRKELPAKLFNLLLGAFQILLPLAQLLTQVFDLTLQISNSVARTLPLAMLHSKLQ